MLLGHEPLYQGLLHLLPRQGEDPGLLHRVEHQRVVQPPAAAPHPQRPRALDARQVDAGQLVDADAVPDDVEAALLEAARTGDQLALALALQVHHHHVQDGAEVGEGVHDGQVAPGRVLHRVEPHQLRVPSRDPMQQLQLQCCFDGVAAIHLLLTVEQQHEEVARHVAGGWTRTWKVYQPGFQVSSL